MSCWVGDSSVTVLLPELTGVFVLPAFAKFVVVKKPARPAREGIDPPPHQREAEIRGEARQQGREREAREGDQGRGVSSRSAPLMRSSRNRSHFSNSEPMKATASCSFIVFRGASAS